MMVRILVVFAIIGLCIMAAEQGKADHTLKSNENLRFFQFRLRNFPDDEIFVAGTSDSIVLSNIDQQLALPVDQRFLFINGLIDSTNGGHNLGWSWHFVPDQWAIVQVSIELCDGIPSMVESNLPYWLNIVGSFCPWSSYVFVELDGCCFGTTGNIDYDSGGNVDIADLTLLISHLFVNFEELQCPAEANTDGDLNCAIDIGDLTRLIDHLFITFSPLEACDNQLCAK